MPKFYAETSVISGPWSGSPRIAAVSRIFWEKVKERELDSPHISPYVLAEIDETSDATRKRRLVKLASICMCDAPSGREVETLARE